MLASAVSALPLDPSTSRFSSIWGAFACSMLVLICFAVPYEVAFAGSPARPNCFWLNRAFDIFTLCDMAISCVTAPPSADRVGVRETKLSSAVRSYVRRSLLLDLLSLSSVVDNFTPFGQDARCLRAVRMCRLLRIRHVLEISREWQITGGCNNASLSLVNSLLIIFILTHIMACAWSFLAIYGPACTPATHTWLDALRTLKPGEDWMYETPSGIYCLSLYWAIMTFTSIGYGDITPQTYIEYCVCGGCMLLSGGLWALTIGQVCGVVTNLLPHDVEMKKMLDELNWLMRERNVPQSVRTTLRRYMFESANVRRLEEQRAVIQQISPMLQGHVIGSMMDAFRHRVSYFRDMRPEVVQRLSRELHATLYAPNEVVTMQRALMAARRGSGWRGGRILVAGDVWGEDAILSRQALRDLTPVRCLGFFEVLSLQLSAVWATLEYHPQEKEQVRWAAIKLAFNRIIRNIATAGRSAGLSNLSEEERCDLITGVITTGHAPSMSSHPSLRKRGTGASFAGVPPRVTTAGLTPRSNAHSADAHDIAEIKAALAELVQDMKVVKLTVAGLQR